LLDNQRLISQLLSLERRTARGGRDSIDHPPGARDDVINAASGALVLLALDKRPSLVKQSDLLAAGKPLPVPCHSRYIIGVMATDKFGQAAAIFAATIAFVLSS
jgi:hypothetical protein